MFSLLVRFWFIGLIDFHLNLFRGTDSEHLVWVFDFYSSFISRIRACRCRRIEIQWDHLFLLLLENLIDINTISCNRCRSANRTNKHTDTTSSADRSGMPLHVESSDRLYFSPVPAVELEAPARAGRINIHWLCTIARGEFTFLHWERLCIDSNYN